MMLIRILVCILSVALPAATAFAQSGKIAGTVTDASTGETLPGVNVVIDGTTQGAVTDVDGYYVILNVSPGTYALRASYVGHTPLVKENVRVNIDLTTNVDFQLQEATVGMDEVIIAAERPIVQRDVSANVANLSAQQMEDLPITSVEGVLGLQAGIEPGLQVRGGGLDQIGFIVDGMSMRDGRDNTPFTGISYTAIEEMQVQTGGFSAEYGNVRSGLINVVTKEGPRDHYSIDAIIRYGAPTQKYFGITPGDDSAYWIRPFVDPDVAFVGTHSKESGWDHYAQRQYPRFEGWNAVAEKLQADDDPTNDMTPEELLELFRWRHRKSFEIEAPDYEVDASVGGPVPLLSKPLGDLRFFASFRQTQNAFLIPQMRDTYQDRTGQVKLTSNLRPGMKLQFNGLYAVQQGINTTQTGHPSMFNGENPRYPWDNRNNLMSNDLGRTQTFMWDYWSPMDIKRLVLGAEFTHTLSASTFYKASLQRTGSVYRTFPGRRRNPEPVKQIGDHWFDEAPYGWDAAKQEADYSNLRIAGQVGRARDSSDVAVWSGRFDLTSQLNRFMQAKAGVEYTLSDYDVWHAKRDSSMIHQANPVFEWNREPTQGAAYVQSKIEVKGMVANLGVRFDYFHAGGEWYDVTPFDRAFTAQIGYEHIDELIEQKPVDRQVALSPRLGVAFPVTDKSKLYFNYGHFRNMLNPHSLFRMNIINTGAITEFGNPSHPMPKTVAYELGYDHNLFNQFLLRISGFYRDASDQPAGVNFVNLDGMVDYVMSLPSNYQDVRGFEVTLSRDVGRWVRGFANYTYMARKGGNFGFQTIYQNRVQMRDFIRQSRAHYQNRPVPEPFARFGLTFLTPKEFGPQVTGFSLLGDWRATLLGEWRSGDIFTWDGGEGSQAGLENNVQWRDYYNLDLRLSKNFRMAGTSANFFVDVANVLNIQHMNRYSAFATINYRDYMESLHLPEDTFEDIGMDPYAFVYGNDRPGDARKEGVPFTPIEIVKDQDGLQSTPKPSTRALYYVSSEAEYYQWSDDGTFAPADKQKVRQVLEDKAYIDMPDGANIIFLNPRRVMFGLRVSF